MLNAMRSGAGSVFAKLLLCLLILSFGVWGIEDMLRYGGQGAELASVGSHEITRTTFDRAYRREAERLRAQMGKHYSPELLKMLQLQHKVMQNLVTVQLLQMEARALGLTPSDDDVADEIRRMDAFKNEKGAFDKAAFTATLRQNGLSEKAFVADTRSQIATQLLLSTVTAAAPLHDRAAAVLYAARAEERSAELAVLTPALLKEMPAPSEEDVKKYYDAHASAFVQPEYRSGQVLVVSKAALLKNITVTEEELQAAYAERASLFGTEATPFEKVRATLEQDVKSAKADEALAEFSTKLEDLFAAGDSVADVAKALGLEAASFGPVDAEGNATGGAKAKLPDYPRLLELTFKTEENSATPLTPLKDGAYFLVHVDSVQQEAPQPLAQVRDKALAGWKKQEAAMRLSALAESLEKEMKEAENPGEVLEKHGIRTTPLAGVKRGGQQPSLPPGMNDALFSVGVGKATGALATKDGNYAIAIVKTRKAPPAASPAQLAKDPEFAKFRAQLEDSAREQLLEDYLRHLRGKYDVRINAAALAAYADAQE